jgi:hypothetical protein
MKGAWNRELLDMLSRYTEDITIGIQKIAGDVGKETKDKVKEGIATQGIKGSKYKKSWTVKVEKGREFVHVTVHASKPHYRLTHLLENGHATRDGGQTRKFKHIAPASEFAKAEFKARVEKLIENGGKE